MAPRSADYSFYASMVMGAYLTSGKISTCPEANEHSQRMKLLTPAASAGSRWQMRRLLERLSREPAPPVAGSWRREVTQVAGWGACVSGMSSNPVAMAFQPL